MNVMDFFSERFGTQLEGPIQFGDEVIDKHGIKAVVVREPYPVGSDHEPFTEINYGYHMSSCAIRNLKKTGKSYAKELNTIFEGLKGGDAE